MRFAPKTPCCKTRSHCEQGQLRQHLHASDIMTAGRPKQMVHKILPGCSAARVIEAEMHTEECPRTLIAEL